MPEPFEKFAQHPHINSVIAPDRAGSSTVTESEKTVEQPKKKISARGVLIGIGGAAAGAAITTAIVLGIGANKEPVTTAPPETDDRESSEIVEEAPAIPPEAQDFINAYTDRYPDPLAAYYAEAAYIEDNEGRSPTIGQDYIDNYDFSQDTFYNGETSPLEFTVPRIPLDTPLSIENSMAQFNEFAPVLSKTLNLIAKNPTPEQISVIKDEFVKYAGYGNPGADDLFGYLQEIVARHGSAANYTVNPGTLEEGASPQENSVFMQRNVVIDTVDENGAPVNYSFNFDLSVTVEVFDNTGESSVVYDGHPDIQLSVSRSEFDPLDVGYVGFGAK